MRIAVVTALFAALSLACAQPTEEAPPPPPDPLALACPPGATQGGGAHPTGSDRWFRPKIVDAPRESRLVPPDEGRGIHDLELVAAMAAGDEIRWCEQGAVLQGPTVQVGQGVRVDGSYAGGQPDGAWTGTIGGSPAFTAHYRQGLRDAEWKCIAPICGGAIGSFKADKPDGLWTWTGAQETMSVTLSDGVLNGPYTRTLADAVWKGRFRDGERAGVWTTTVGGNETERVEYGTEGRAKAGKTPGARPGRMGARPGRDGDRAKNRR